MKPDQERVNNLLRDTVTLLCKNGLTYSDELRVEALIGITVDSNDVFLVHINEKFGPGGENKVPNPPEESKEDTRDSARPQSNTNSNSGRECAAETPQASPAQSDRLQRTLSVDSSSLSSPQGAASSQMDLSKVKLEAVDSDDECIVVKSPGTVARQANMVAGQRRVLHRPRSYASPSHSGLHANQDDTHAMRQRYAQDMAGSEEAYTDYDPDTGEPPVKIKRQEADDEDTYGSSYNQHMDNNQGNIGTHWPHVAGMGDMTAQSFQDSGDSQISASDVSMPGCSSWSVAGGAQRSMMPHQGSDMTMYTTSHLNKYPSNNLSSRTIRHGLRKHLAVPVDLELYEVHSFRIVWRFDEPLLDYAWGQLVQNQLVSDQVLAGAEGVSYFISGLTGIFNKPNRKGEVPKNIYPAVSYWLVARRGKYDHLLLWQCLQNVYPSAQIKTIGTPEMDTVDSIAAALCIVLKDHSSRYMRTRVDASSAMCFDGGKGEHPLVRLVLKDREDFEEQLSQAVGDLEAVKMYITMSLAT